tara:strand:+ start:370 stop:579 length:210 start_codon:yes stop_codon:yes gene_type:complete
LEDDEFDFNNVMLSRHKLSGEILFFGFPLFGGWLPFIGFRTEAIEDIVYRAFIAEWFMYSVGYVTHIEE